MAHAVKRNRNNPLNILLNGKFLLVLFLILAVVITTLILRNPKTFRPSAATAPTATISASPATQTVQGGDTFNVNVVVDGGGVPFNAAQATVVVSSNLTVLSVTPPASTSGGCNFKFVDTQTPTPTNPSFAGAILNGSSTNCIVYTAQVRATSPGTGTITFSSESVKAYSDSSEIFLSSTNGQYTINSVSITPTGPVTPTATPTPVTSKVPLSFNPSTRTVNPGDTFTVDVVMNVGTQTTNAIDVHMAYNMSRLKLTAVSTSPLLSILTPDDTADQMSKGTWVENGTVVLSRATITPVTAGTRIAGTLTFQALTIPGTTPLTFDLTTTRIMSTQSPPVNIVGNASNASFTINAPLVTPPPATSTPIPTGVSTSTPTPLACIASSRKSGDTNGDDAIDLVDVSILFKDWDKGKNQLLNPGSDLNCDGIVNLTDFSMLARSYQG